MALNIPAIAEKLNRLAPAHRIGNLQTIRTKLKGLARQPGTKIFAGKTITEEWACHYGGRTELQFNIGYVNDVEPYQLRFGVAFSFELSQTLPSIDVLVPKVKFFNDFILLNADDFSDMRIWHYNPDRSADYMPGPISSGGCCHFARGAAHGLVDRRHGRLRRLSLPGRFCAGQTPGANGTSAPPRGGGLSCVRCPSTRRRLVDLRAVPATVRCHRSP